MSRLRADLKRVLSVASPTRTAGEGVTALIYHRVGGGGRDELDVSRPDFEAQVDELSGRSVVSLDQALDGLDRRDRRGRVVLTFDDGFGDVYENAWPLLRERRMPFTVYLASAYIGGAMAWTGSTAKDSGAPAMTWDQLGEMVASGLCTVGNHTHTHVPPEHLSESELDRCSELVEARLGLVPRHFAYPWGTPVPTMTEALSERFRSAATGRLGRNLPGVDPMLLTRVPVRRTDPIEFFRAKLVGVLLAERVYGGIVATAKRAGAHA